jgi:hypothetical protein
MPAKPKKEPKRTRLQITPSPELWRLIDLVHAKTGEPRAAVVSELLDQVAPAFQTMIAALEMVQESPRQAQRLMTNYGAEKVAELMQMQVEFDHTLTQKELELDKGSDGRTVKGKRARRRSGGTT